MTASESSSTRPKTKPEVVAFLVTTIGGVLTGIFSAWGDSTAKGATTVKDFVPVTIAITAVGGVVMGAIFLKHWLDRRRAQS